MFGFTRQQGIAFLVMFAAVVIAPFFLYPVFLMKVLCFALFACAYNLLIGYVGLGSFGHAAFFGMGGYIAAFTAKKWGFNPEIAIITGAAAGAVLGAVFGWGHDGYLYLPKQTSTGFEIWRMPDTGGTPAKYATLPVRCWPSSG